MLLSVRHPHNAKCPDPSQADSLFAKGTDSNTTCMLLRMPVSCQDRGGRNPCIQTTFRPQVLHPGSHLQHHICHLPCNLSTNQPRTSYIEKQAKQEHHNMQQCTQAVCSGNKLQGPIKAASYSLPGWGLHMCLLAAQHALQAGGPPELQAQQTHLPHM